MLLFERRWYAAGRAAARLRRRSSKLFPGVLVLYLLLRRDWRAVGLDRGVERRRSRSWRSPRSAPRRIAISCDHMPKLLSGEAFPAFRNPDAIGVNQSVPGLVFKLKLFGVPHMDFTAMRIVGWLYTVVVVAGTAWLALRAAPRGREPLHLADHPDPRDAAQPVPADLRRLPDVLAGDAGRRGRAPIGRPSCASPSSSGACTPSCSGSARSTRR